MEPKPYGLRTGNTGMKKFVLVFILACFTFLRFWDIEGRMQFTWDQVQNAWVMKDMIVDGKLPLEGMVAKLNSGFYIGPAYYYLLVPFYLMFNLDPVAAGVFAGVVAVASVVVFYVLVRALFSPGTAIVAIAIYAFSSHIIVRDRIAWPVIFLPVLATVTYYVLVRLMQGKTRYLPQLALTLGASLHIHFTSIFFFLYTIASLPFFVRAKGFVRFALVSLPLFLVWFIPTYIAGMRNGFSQGTQVFSYIQTYYHGFHFVRVMQLIPEVLIEFGSILGVSQLRFVKYFMLPVFLVLYWRKHPTHQGIRLCFLTALWFVVPLIVFSLYSGEISDYYFVVTRPIVIMIYAYVTTELFALRRALISTLVSLFWLYVLYFNMNLFFGNNYGNHLPKIRQEVRTAIGQGGAINFTEGDPKSYLYYLYAQR